MTPTRLHARQPHRTTARRLVALTLAAAASISLVPTARVDAESLSQRRRTCATESVATYTIASGDSWFRVATAAGVSTKALVGANSATASTVLYPGDVLCLPNGVAAPAATSSQGTSSSSGCAATHTVVSGDSWFAISRAAGVSMNGLLEANKAKATTVIKPGAQLCLPAGAAPVNAAPAAQSCIAQRAVVAGESWYSISRSTGVPIEALVAANDKKQSSAIFPGQNLCLPEVGFGRDLPGMVLKASPLRGSCRFANSWQATRGGGRLHQGVDLISPEWTPVIAAASGTLTRQAVGGSRSGNAWWLTTPSGTYFFYAHLAGFAKGLEVGSNVNAGDVIGYVGSTGNAVSPHLHFEIHPGGGGASNPYDAIWMSGGCTYDKRYEQIPLS